MLMAMVIDVCSVLMVRQWSDGCQTDVCSHEPPDGSRS